MKKLMFPFLIALLFSFLGQAQEIGLQLYSLRNQFKTDVKGTFAKINAWGISKVEDGNDGTMGFSKKEFKTILKENNLEIVSASATFEELQNHPEQALERANRYGSKYLVCFWIPHRDTSFTIKEPKWPLMSLIKQVKF